MLRAVAGLGAPGCSPDQSPQPTSFMDCTRTRYSVPFVRPVIDWDAAGGSASVRLTATQPAEASVLLPASSSSSTAFWPVSGALV